MSSERTVAVRTRRLMTLAGMTSLALAFAVPAKAQEDVDLDLKPADFSPDEPIAIRVDDLQPGRQGSDVSVTVANRTNKDVRAVVECTLYDAGREDLGLVTGEATVVEAGRRKAIVVTGAEGAKHAECRVRDAK